MKTYIIVILLICLYIVSYGLSGWALFCIVVVLGSLSKFIPYFKGLPKQSQRLVIRGNNNQVSQTNRPINRRFRGNKSR